MFPGCSLVAGLPKFWTLRMQVSSACFQAPGSDKKLRLLCLSKFRWDRHSLHLLEIEIWNVTEMIQASVSVRVCRDPKDDHVLETCLAGGADLLVTATTICFWRDRDCDAERLLYEGR
jgi:PIN domain